MTTAFHLKRNFECTNWFVPYLNWSIYQADHVLAIELASVASFFFVAVVALQTKRLGSLVGILGFCILLEFGAFRTRALAHAPYRIQLGCFLPLKDVLWNATNIFVALVAGEQAGLESRWQAAALIGTLATMQSIPFEMVRILGRIEDVYVNENRFPYANLKDKINGAYVFFLMIMFCSAAAVGLLSIRGGSKPSHGRDIKSVIIIPLLGPLIACCGFVPFYLVKYVGCRHFVNSEPTFELFHFRCAKYSYIEDVPVFVFLSSVVLCGVLVGLARRSDVAQLPLSVLSKVLLMATRALLNGVVLYALVEGSTLTTIALHSQVPFYLAVMCLDCGMIYLCLFVRPDQSNPSRDTIKHKVE